MKMHPSDVHVIDKNGPDLYVISNFNGYGLQWPDTLTYVDRTYKFQSNEPMLLWMHGNVSGHAKYVEIKA